MRQQVTVDSVCTASCSPKQGASHAPSFGFWFPLISGGIAFSLARSEHKSSILSVSSLSGCLLWEGHPHCLPWGRTQICPFLSPSVGMLHEPLKHAIPNPNFCPTPTSPPLGSTSSKQHHSLSSLPGPCPTPVQGLGADAVQLGSLAVFSLDLPSPAANPAPSQQAWRDPSAW
jgi:hypothetical protein